MHTWYGDLTRVSDNTPVDLFVRKLPVGRYTQLEVKDGHVLSVTLTVQLSGVDDMDLYLDEVVGSAFPNSHVYVDGFWTPTGLVVWNVYNAHDGESPFDSFVEQNIRLYDAFKGLLVEGYYLPAETPELLSDEVLTAAAMALPSSFENEGYVVLPCKTSVYNAAVRMGFKPVAKVLGSVPASVDTAIDVDSANIEMEPTSSTKSKASTGRGKRAPRKASSKKSAKKQIASDVNTSTDKEDK